MTITVSGTPAEIHALLAEKNITVNETIHQERPQWYTLNEACRLKYVNWEAARDRVGRNVRLQPNGGMAEDMLGSGPNAQKLFRRETVEKWLSEPLWEIQFREEVREPA